VRIRFSRTGGVGGTRLSLELDTAKLPEAERRRLEALVRSARRVGAEARRGSPPRGADRFVYRIRLEDGEPLDIETDEEQASREVLKLVETLVKLARRTRRP
jgi:hypothetical protein